MRIQMTGVRYAVVDLHGDVVCWFDRLEPAAIVKRYLDGEALTAEQQFNAVRYIQQHDERMKKDDGSRKDPAKKRVPARMEPEEQRQDP